MINKDAVFLLVDDEANNLRLLKADLEDAGYENFLTAVDGVDAWKILQEKYHEIDLVLLDRMMPNMDGMEVLDNMRAHGEMHYIPIIMQTAAASKEQMLEGIAAGVYYYLTKPYDDDTLITVVNAALRDTRDVKKMRDEISQFKPKLHLFREGGFRIRTLEDANYLGTFLAGVFPDPARTVFGLTELLINGIEHGNLGISYNEKSELIYEDMWQDEIERRLQLPENKDKFVDVQYQYSEKEIVIKIKDQGKGFDWKEYMEITPERATHSHGRGIAMAAMLSFDTLEFKGSGNEVWCGVNLKKQSKDIPQGDKGAANETLALVEKKTVPSPSARANVLVVDDNQASRMVIRAMLVKMGCNVDEAVNGEEAIRQAVANPYDAIFMDCHMPRLDGYDATKELRLREKHNEMQPQIIIAVTAQSMPGDREKCLQVGMNDYMAKPLREDELRAMLDKWLGMERKAG